MKTLVAVLLGSSMVLSFSADARTCADVWASNPQSQSEGFIRVSMLQPDVTNEVKDESVKLCETAAEAGRRGMSEEDVLSGLEYKARKLPAEGKASLVFMLKGGWKIGRGE